ncbi:hypothetical protein BY996DRAFT_6485892 [Phakopsora pachyrhizi]|nr:hypothetical protein BY996DRAFT_6485892 [Phakopsora pachyrhizi]
MFWVSTWKSRKMIGIELIKRTEESAGVCLGLSEETASQKIIRAIKFNLGSPSKRKDQISYQMEIQSEEQFQGLQDDIDQENDNGDKDLSEKEDRAIKTQDGLEGAELEDIQERDGKDGGGDGDNDEEDCDDNVEDGVGKVNPIDSGSCWGSFSICKCRCPYGANLYFGLMEGMARIPLRMGMMEEAQQLLCSSRGQKKTL